MSGGNGNEGAYGASAGGLRGGIETSSGDVRDAQGGWPVATPSPISQGQPYPQPVQTATITPTSTNQLGFSVTLTREQVEQAIKARAMKFAQSRGVVVPSDEVDFQFRAEVHPLPDGGAAVTLKV